MGTSEAEEAPEEQRTGPLPFFTIQGTVRRDVQVQAGWAEDGEIVQQTIDATVDPGSADQQAMVALEWWLNRWAELLQQVAEEEEVEDDRR